MIDWIKDQGLALLCITAIAAVCIPMFFYSLADLASGPVALDRSCTPIQRPPCIRNDIPSTTPSPDVNASRVAMGFSSVVISSD